MLYAAIVFFLCLLPKYNAQLITSPATCLSGYNWMFTSIDQSPCDVAAELAAVCVGGQFDLEPLDVGYVYLGPTVSNANDCRCSTVYYSLLSACAYCQGRNYLSWSGYDGNCSTVYVTVYTEEIPVGVKVPAWAYQDVTVANTFNVTLAEDTTGTESSRLPASSTTIPGLASPSVGGGNSNSNNGGSNSNNGGSKPNVGAIVGGVVGGLVFLGLLGVLIAFLLRSKKKPKSEVYDSNFKQSPDTAFSPHTTASLIPSTMSPPAGTPGKIYDPNDPATYPSIDPSSTHGSFNMYAESQRQQSPFNPNLTPNYTGNSYQTMPVPQHTGVSHYTGAPEL